MQATAKQVIRLLRAYIEARIVPMIVGSPGVGKSDLVRQVAATYGLKLIDVRLAQCDPTDLCGFPRINNGRAGYAPMDTFPIEGDKVPEGYNGWLIFLDELTSAPMAVQAAAYRLILDRQVGQHPMHKNVVMVAAGNRTEDNAIVMDISTALQSRMAWIDMVVDKEDWLDWAMEHKMHHFITDYIKFKPSALYTFKPDHTDHTYACPRSWEFTNRLMPLLNDKQDFLHLLSGVISEGVAREFIGFTRVYKELPKIEAITSNPNTVHIPQEPSVLFALSGSLANHATKDNIGKLMKYIQRMPEEFQVVTLKETVRRDPSMLAHAATRDWLAKAGATLF